MRRIKWLAGTAGLLLLCAFAPGGVGLASTTTVPSTSGAFTIVVPRGFRQQTVPRSGGAVKFELVLAGSRENGFAVNINVVRERTGTATVGTLAQDGITELKRSGGAKDFSTVTHLTLDGASGLAVDFLASFGATGLLHERQVFTIHNGWGYVVTYTALPGAQYQRSLSALSECLASWRWR